MPVQVIGAAAGATARGVAVGARVAGRAAASGAQVVGKGVTSAARGAVKGAETATKGSIQGVRAASRASYRVGKVGYKAGRTLMRAAREETAREEEEKYGYSIGGSPRKFGLGDPRRNLVRAFNAAPIPRTAKRMALEVLPTGSKTVAKRMGMVRPNRRGLMQRARAAAGMGQGMGSPSASLTQKLSKEVEAGNDTTAFMIALSLAACKDFLDIVITITSIGIIPGVNFLISLFINSILFFFMMGKGWLKTLRLKVRFLFPGLFVDGLPLMSMLPVSSLLVWNIWREVQKRAKEAEQQMRSLPINAPREPEAMYRDDE